MASTSRSLSRLLDVPRIYTRQILRRNALMDAEWERKQRQQRAKAYASWRGFARRIKNAPDDMLGTPRIANTAFNLFQTMRRARDAHSSSGWDRAVLEAFFGKAIVDQLRTAMMPLWRQDKPELPSERPANQQGKHYLKWDTAFAAIAAEAEDPHWPAQVTQADAETAIRYAMLHVNRLPAWFEALATAQPAPVQQLLRKELAWQFTRALRSPDRVMLLQDIEYGPPMVPPMVLPELRRRLRVRGGWSRHYGNSSGAADLLRQIATFLLKFGNESDQKSIARVCAAELRLSTEGPIAQASLALLFASDPPAATLKLERLCDTIAPGPRNKAVEWFALLFGRHRHDSGVVLSQPNITPDLLVRLLRLAYAHVRRSDDANREGPYTPDIRDDAEMGRNALLTAVLDLPGPDGWDAKLEVASDTALAGLKDRLIALAKVRSAIDANPGGMSLAEIARLGPGADPAPRSAAEMFALILDRLEDLQDHLQQDTSPRVMWAGVTQEFVMRRAIAAHLQQCAAGAYTIAQESVTGEEKETDIRLRSVGHAIEGVIELKLAEGGYTATGLRDTISSQLIGKYLKPESRRAGCLLITRARRERWRQSAKRAWLDFDALIAMLREAAVSAQSDFPGELYVDVAGLDLRAPH